jgi:hypothetical protein
VSDKGTRPCYICGGSVGLTEGWHLDGKQWCENHQPVWAHLRLKCEALHPDSDKGYAPIRCSRRLGHGGEHAATTKGPRDQWWKPRLGDVPELPASAPAEKETR